MKWITINILGYHSVVNYAKKCQARFCGLTKCFQQVSKRRDGSKCPLKTSVKLRVKPFLLLVSMIQVILKGKHKVLLRVSYWLILRKFSLFRMYFILSFNSYWNIADQSLKKEISNSCQWEIPLFYGWRTVCQEMPSSQLDFKKGELQIPWTLARSKDHNLCRVINSFIKARLSCIMVSNPVSQRKGSYRTIICPIFSLPWYLFG